MRKQEETKFKEKVARRLKTIPNLWFVKIQQVAVRGTPDFLICYEGNFFAWELKTAKGKLSKLQSHNLKLIDRAGGSAWTVTPINVEICFRAMLKRFDEPAQFPG